MANLRKSSNDVRPAYYKELASLNILHSDEEYKLAVEVTKGSIPAKNKMITSNLKLVIAIVKRDYKHQIQYLCEDDLIEEGNMGLMKAVEQFDPYLGFAFSTFATNWIKYYISKYIMDNSRTIRIPVGVIKTMSKVFRFQKEFQKEKGKEPTVLEIANNFSITEDEVNYLLSLKNDSVSLDNTLNEEDSESSLHNFVSAESSYEPDNYHDTDHNNFVVYEMISKLNEREQNIIVRRFGLNGHEPMTLEEIGNEFSISKERVRQIIKESLSYIKDIALANDMDKCLEL